MEKTQSNILSTPLFDNLRKLINVIDELKDVGLQQYIKLPRICVVGTQSSGKSSLLESIVGLDFLPRGSGVVTRRPLELRLIHVPLSSGKIKPWACFDKIDEKFTDFEKVKAKIDELTDKIAGKNKGIINDPIKLTIYSNDCPDLTLVDLPGITRIPLKGTDQKQDIEKITIDMASLYAKDERTIILAVVAANQDMSTSDGLKLAMEIDKDGKRTLGVITKIDIMDRGTDARKMLTNQEINLKLGYVGVKGRSQEDINNNVKVQQALEMEREYFAKHPVYSTLDPKYYGTKSLTSTLSTIFFQHIRTYLPQIINEIREKIRDCEDRLKELGPALPSDNREKMQMVWEKITEFTDNFKNSISGKYDPKRAMGMNSELSGGAIIKMMFNELYDQYSDKYKATSGYTDKDIDRAVVLHQGDCIPGFPSIDAFLYLINPQLEKLKEPAMETLTSVYNYLENLSTKLIKRVFAQVPGIIEEISEISSKAKEKAQVVVENIIESEQGYLFTNDKEYLATKTALIPKAKANEKGDKNDPNQKPVQIDPKKVFLDELRSRVDEYYSLVIRNIRDQIPKSIGYFLVKGAQEQMQYTLYNEMLQRESAMNLLNEPPHIKEERDTVEKTLEVLRKAQKVLKRDPDISTSSVKCIFL